MTGHNHYSNCTCGWCVNTGRTRINSAQVLADLRRRDALALLDRHSARSISSCYVNPNAPCPVCGATVFFYANAFGSRVFFDELGPPWTKHPCTDNPKRKYSFQSDAVGPPLRRPRGIALELVAAARSAQLFAPSAAAAEGWRLLVVVSAERNGDKNLVVAEFLDSIGEQAKFSYHSSVPLLEAGDFVSKRGDEISFLNRTTLATVNIRDGAVVSSDAPEAVVAKGPRPPVVRRPGGSKDKVIRSTPGKSSTKYDMTEAEVAHFHSDSISVADMCDKFGPIVKSYARSGSRKPRDVAVRLNAEGHKTAIGASWTPRLTHFLLGLIFSAPAQEERPENKPSHPAPKIRSKPESRQVAERPLTQADLVHRLSALGRVVVKK